MFDFVKEDSFKLEKTSEYILSIQVSLDGFSFSVTDPAEKKIIAFKKTPIKISDENRITRHFIEWLNSVELFKNDFQKIILIVFSPKFSLIPEELYQSNLKNELPKHLFEVNDEIEIVENYIEKLRARLVFALPKNINQVVQEFFGMYEIIHPLKLIINNLPHQETDNETAMFLTINTTDFYAVLYKNNNVLLVNNFKIGHSNDVIYFVVNILQQLEISSQQTKIILAQSNAENTEIVDSLRTYFKKTEDFKPNIEIENSIAGQSFLHYF